MQWFEDQIKQRKKNDDQAFSNVFNEIAGSVLGKHRVLSEDKNVITNSVIDEILKYYDVDFDPDEGEKNEDSLFKIDNDEEDEFYNPLDGIEEKLQTRLEPHGILFRHVKLDEKWEKKAIGPLIGTYNDNIVAFIPNRIKGYTFLDLNTGKRVKVKGNVSKKIGIDAICFYEPLPATKLHPIDLLKFAFKTTNTSDIILIAVITFLTALLDIILPIASNYLFTDIVKSREISALIAIGITLVCMTVSAMMLDYVKSFVSTKIEIKQSVSVDAAVMMRVLSMPAEFYRNIGSGELTKMIDYASELTQNLLDLILDFSLTFIFSFTQIFVMNMYAPSLVWIVLIIMAVNILFSLLTIRLEMNQNKKLINETAKEYGIGYALIAGIQKIKLAGAEKRAFVKWGKHYSQKAEYIYNPPFLLKISDVISLIIEFAGLIAIYAVAYISNITPADYYAFDVSYGIFSSAVLIFTGASSILASIGPTNEMIKPILETIPENGSGKEIVKNLRGRIELEHVSFSYEEGFPNIINDLSLSIKAGEYVAIVGTTGCGKSTLIRLLLGFEHPNHGSIYFDNYDINTVDIRSLRRKIGSVTQNGKLFMGSIFSNIAITAPQLDIDGAWEAAELADIADDINEMPMGMQTLVTEGGAGLSGGQKQRIMIARALASKPKILIFDEATSALDNISQKKVSDSIDNLNCTRIVIAHRLSTIKNCDRILVLDKGKIVEEGNYETLIEKNGLFANLVARQRLDN